MSEKIIIVASKCQQKKTLAFPVQLAKKVAAASAIIREQEAKQTRQKKRPGRPVEPGSLRQSGRNLVIRVHPDLLERAKAAAGDRPLSELVREYLENLTHAVARSG